jgi:hypothetical protein
MATSGPNDSGPALAMKDEAENSDNTKNRCGCAVARQAMR